MQQMKEFFRRRMALLLACVMVLSMLPVTAFAAETPTEGNTETAAIPETAVPMYIITTEDGLRYYHNGSYIEILGYTGSATELVIPDQIEGVPVTKISWAAFSGCEELVSVTLPESVTVIDGNAFSQCSSLTSIGPLEQVIEIGSGAFDDCTSLTSFDLPDNLRELDSFVFSGCTSLRSIELPSGLVSIGDETFSGCRSLNGITIPASVTSIGVAAFYGCIGFNEIDLPSNLASLGGSAFAECTSLTRIGLPDALTSIGGYAFSGCSALTGVDFPAGLTSIGDAAFRNCTSLTRISLPNGITTIAPSVFDGCSALTSIDLPDALTSIGGSAFSGCSALASIDFPDSLTSIGWSSFKDCASLTAVDFPAGLQTIGYSAFSRCNGLRSVFIPAQVTSLGNTSFKYCKNLTAINVSDQNSVYASVDGVLYDKECKSLISYPEGKSGSYTVPDGVTEILDEAFEGCSQLQEITVPDSVASVGSYAFYYCRGLTSLKWPSASSCISDFAMSYCDNLKTLTIPGSVTQVGYKATLGCGNLTDVYYDGTRSEWKQIWIEEANTGIENATIHFNDGTTSNDPEPHDTLDTLTDLDYMAFSELSYESLTAGVTVKEFLADKWEKKWHDIDLTYSDVYGSVGNWLIRQYTYNDGGFYAAVFVNDANQAVISYRGSKPLNGENYPELLEPGTDIFYDWVLNDLAMQVCDAEGTQLRSALSVYDGVAGSRGADNVVVTGHSLGGGLANLVSAYSGSRAVSVNAISVLDVSYSRNFSIFGKAFRGVDAWDIRDHANNYDILAGMYEYWQDGIHISQLTKPYVAHMSRYELSNVAANHGIASIITKDTKGNAALTSVVGSFKPTKPITQMISEITISDVLIPLDLLFDNFSYLDLGTTSNDVFRSGMAVITPRVSYGGDGVDDIAGAVMTDVIIGGPGPDDLDGSYGDDMYVYYKGDGHDEIRDISGDDAICLYGFADEDVIEVIYDGNTVDLKCNGEKFISIYDNGRAYDYFSLDSFVVYIKQSSGIKKVDITEYFSTRKYGSHMVIACPVDVEVLNSEGIVVYTLKDGEASTAYTDYGNFYVFEEEDGGYGKVLDLVEGYTARIVGAGEGTMDVTYQVPVDGELTDPVSVTEVPVTDSLVATIEEDEENNVYLVIDADGDGAADEQLLLEAEHVHEWDEGTVTKEATCTEAGEITYACSGCEETMTETVEAKGHAYEAVVTDPTCTEQGYTTYTCTGCGDSYVSDYVDAGHRYTDGVCTGCGKVETIVAYTQASLSLAGDIGVNYYVKLSSDIVADEGAYMQFTVAGETQNIPVNEAEVNADGTYRFSCKVAAKQMTDLITGQIYLSDGTAVGAAKTYSVKAYCDAAIPFYSQNADYAELVALMKAMMNYGGYSQVQFGYNTDNLANAGLDLPLPAPTEEDVSFYANYAQGSEEGISVASASLLLESTTTIRFYFQLDGSRSIEAYTFCVDGEETAPVQVSENMYYVDKVNVAARDLDHMATVTVGGLTARYCGLSYVRQVAVLHADVYSENLVNVAKALYAYNQAANAYFE